MLRPLAPHRLLLGVVAVGVALRVAVSVAYWPALTFVDSWGYIDTAYSTFPFGFSYDRPSGYSFLLRVLSLPGKSLATITVAQHAAGILTAVLAYALLIRLDVGRKAAAAVAALLVLDAWALALEQYVLTEAFFTAAVMASAFLIIARTRGLPAIAASGALVGLAATMRPTGAVAIVAWLAYLPWVHRRPLKVVIGIVAVAIPLGGYLGYHYAENERVGVSENDGWILYGRVGPIADCRGVEVPQGASVLCEPPGVKRSSDPDFYLWSGDSPARRAFGQSKPEDLDEVNALLRRFALAVIRAHPGAYASAAGGDLVGMLTPGGPGVDTTINFPERESGAANAPLRPCRGCEGVATPSVDPLVRDRWFPGYEPQARQPSSALAAFGEIVHAPRWLLGAFAVLSIAALGAALARASIPRWPEILLLSGSAIAMLLVTVATVNPWMRYIVPVEPLLLCGGVLALHDLLAARRRRGSKRVGRRVADATDEPPASVGQPVTSQPEPSRA